MSQMHETERNDLILGTPNNVLDNDFLTSILIFLKKYTYTLFFKNLLYSIAWSDGLTFSFINQIFKPGDAFMRHWAQLKLVCVPLIL